MCGICGVVQIGGPPRQVVAAETLDRMIDAMTHRGPDDRGSLLSPGAALGVRRLSIVDVDGGHQPFSDERGGVWYPRAGTLGGCTAHNALITISGPRADWDAIADELGDPSWSAEAMRGYFERLERNTYVHWWQRLFGNRRHHGGNSVSSIDDSSR